LYIKEKEIGNSKKVKGKDELEEGKYQQEEGAAGK